MYKEIQDPHSISNTCTTKTHTHNMKMILWSFVVTSYEFVVIVLLVGCSVVVCLRIKKERKKLYFMPTTIPLSHGDSKEVVKVCYQPALPRSLQTRGTQSNAYDCMLLHSPFTQHH